MKVFILSCKVISLFSKWSNCTYSIFAASARLYLAYSFIPSGLSKFLPLAIIWENIKLFPTEIRHLVSESTIFLFQYEYNVPFLNPVLAAYLGGISEIVLPILVLIGIFGRLPIIGLFLVNLMAILSYPYLWTPDGFQGLFAHVAWGIMAGFLIANGSGRLAVDAIINWKYPKYKY